MEYRFNAEQRYCEDLSGENNWDGLSQAQGSEEVNKLELFDDSLIDPRLRDPMGIQQPTMAGTAGPEVDLTTPEGLPMVPDLEEARTSDESSTQDQELLPLQSLNGVVLPNGTILNFTSAATGQTGVHGSLTQTGQIYLAEDTITTLRHPETGNLSRYGLTKHTTNADIFMDMPSSTDRGLISDETPLMEILTRFPNHLFIPEVCARLVEGGIKLADMANILMTHRVRPEQQSRYGGLEGVRRWLRLQREKADYHVLNPKRRYRKLRRGKAGSK